MSAEDRRYRVRLAERGAEELVDATVEFALLVSDLGGIPVVGGSIVHPIRGATEMRPLTVLAVDRAGVQTARFGAEKPTTWAWLSLCPETRGRWDMVGRLVDLQWQLTSADPELDAWTTYGTGRCSGFSEASGPGQYQVEISDESWKARKHVRVFEHADTTMLWPAGVRPGRLDPEPPQLPSAWRGLVKVRPAQGEVTQMVSGAVFAAYRIHLSAFTADPDDEVGMIDFSATMRGGIILDPLIRWIRADAKDFVTFDLDRNEGNFEHLRLAYGTIGEALEDYEIIAFRETLPDGETEEERRRQMFEGLVDPVQYQTPGGVQTELDIWVRERRVDGIAQTPPSDGEVAQFGFLWAPGAPPSDALPLHVGVNNPDHPWGTDGGYLHVADLHRRVWDRLGLRYNVDALDALELDLSFPAIAASVGGEAENPERWLQGVRQNCGVVSLRDTLGRLTLVDVRPVREIDFTTLPRVDRTNSRNLRWRVLGRETINLLEVETLRTEYADPDVQETEPARVAGVQPDSTPSLDLVRRVAHIEEYPGDTAVDAGERRLRFQAEHTLEPSAASRRKTDLMRQERGALWEDIADDLLMGWLEMYQDGLWRCTFTRTKDEVDLEAEGDLLVLDHESLKVPNPVTRERSGESVIRLISVTRHPSHAECEAILVPARPLPDFEDPCPEEE